MTNFYFQQFATRGSEGHTWLTGTEVPISWLKKWENMARQNSAIPANSTALQNGKEGGKYIAPNGEFGVIFSIIPDGKKDFTKRRKALIINALFFSDWESLHEKSLKKVWEHPVLNAQSDTIVTNPVTIDLDCDFGKTPAEKDFFFTDTEHPLEEVFMKYPNAGMKKEKTIYESEFSSGKNSLCSWQKSAFIGFLAGIVAGFAIAIFLRPTPEPVDPGSTTEKTKLTEFLLKENSSKETYQLPLEFEIIPEKNDKKMIIYYSPQKEKHED